VVTLALTATAAMATASLAPSQHKAPRNHAGPRPATSGAVAPRVAAVPDPDGLDQIWDYRTVVARETKAAAAAAAQQPKPAAQPKAQNYGSGPIQDIITGAFSQYGPTAVAWWLRVAHCESGFNPRAYNPAGPYYGLFQFLMGTFKATPYGSGDIYDPVANANAAAWKWAHGGAGAWGCK